MSIYELGIFGNASAEDLEKLSTTIARMVEPFGLVVGDEVKLHRPDTVSSRNAHSAFAAAYFGGPDSSDLELVKRLADDSLPIIPVVHPHGNFGAEVPASLQAANGLRLREDDTELTELAVALLECVGLLRRQRRVFISYRRTESSLAALQLHDLLAARGFDVFLDTHDIRPGEPFQEVLWNRLCDSDVMVMLDTPTYFDSKWTRQEIGRARAKGIQVLRVIWPAHTPSKLTDLSETIYLESDELQGEGGPLIEEVGSQIVLAVESLRSRSIASRYMSITGKLRADVEMIGATVEGVGAHRAISIRLLNNDIVWAYPIVGIPTADLFHDVADKARRANHQGAPILVYDHIGIRERWIAHLKWLDENISSVRAIRVSEAGWTLAGWED